ncbi:MAG: acetate/propionate family kinase [Acidimicrobiia bacterium]|nr:acetate/propionate family kinase [Acidimicrobiia bacterium]
MRVLVVNAGSSSLKLRLLGPDDEVLADTEVQRWDGDPGHADIGEFVNGLTDVDAVGHRVVHGGSRFQSAIRLDEGVVAALEALTPLAPLHQPRALAGIRATATLLPDVVAVACFDTAFHATLPPAAATYALPAEWNERFGLRRFGFHGLSHAWAGRRASELLSRPEDGFRLVSAHLGSGASLCAIAGGRSVATTMGFTPLEGLVMATRSGDVDPGLLLYMLQRCGLGVDELADSLQQRSGLAGLSGTSGDMRDVLAAASGGDENAVLAYNVWLHRLRAGVAAMAAAMGGLDALSFTGGIGEHTARARADACSGLGFVGLTVDAEANATTTADGVIGERVVVVTAREDRQIAAEVRALLSP